MECVKDRDLENQEEKGGQLLALEKNNKLSHKGTMAICLKLWHIYNKIVYSCILGGYGKKLKSLYPSEETER